MRSAQIYISFVAITGLFILAGCSASSNSVRYGNKSDDSSHNNSDVRFTSDNDSNNDDVVKSDTISHNIRNLQLKDSDQGDLPENEPPVDISKVIENINPSQNSGNLSSEKGTPKERMLMEIIKYINTPYKYGGSSKSGIDCSGFTQKVYKKSLSINLQRTASQQYHEGVEIENVRDLKFGDLVFFDTRRAERPGHVGIYIGDHLFAHASNKGVTVSSLDLDYYAKRFMGGRRIEEDQFGSR